MNKNLNRAKQLLEGGAALAIVNGGGELTFNERGIKTLLSLQNGSLTGAFAADKVVGKAAAMMMVRGGVTEVYAQLISRPALEVFKAHNKICLYGEVVPYIINRDKTGLCPMEQAVLGVDDVDKAYKILVEKTGGTK